MREPEWKILLRVAEASYEIAAQAARAGNLSQARDYCQNASRWLWGALEAAPAGPGRIISDNYPPNP